MSLQALCRKAARRRTRRESSRADWAGNERRRRRRVVLSSESGNRPGSRRPFSVAARIESFRPAFSGITSLLRSEHNAWIHLVATVLAIVLGLAFGIRRDEWLAIVLAIALVWTAEAVNTAIEALCDVVSPGHDPRIKKAKDVAAGAVLFSAFGALGVGLLVFVPRLLALIES